MSSQTSGAQRRLRGACEPETGAAPAYALRVSFLASHRKNGTTQPKHRAVPRKHIEDGPKSAAASQGRLAKSWTANGFLDRIGAQRRKTASGSPKGEQSESINKINKIEPGHSAQGKEEFRSDQNLSNLFL